MHTTRKSPGNRYRVKTCTIVPDREYTDSSFQTILEEEITDTALSSLCEDVLEDLLLEHLTGRHEGFLKAAMDFVDAYLQTHGAGTDEEIAAAGIDEGFTEEEIAAVLSGPGYTTPFDERLDISPLWADYAGSIH